MHCTLKLLVVQLTYGRFPTGRVNTNVHFSTLYFVMYIQYMVVRQECYIECEPKVKVNYFPNPEGRYNKEHTR